MEIGIIIAMHGSAAKGMLDTVDMLAGKVSDIEIIEFNEGESLDILESKFNWSISSLNHCRGIIVLTDIMGGSPFNVAVKLKDKFLDIITGVNIPVILELNMVRENLKTRQDIDSFVKRSKDSIAQYSTIIIRETDEEF